MKNNKLRAKMAALEVYEKLRGEMEYIIGIEVVQGDEHFIDETSVDAKNEEEALEVASYLVKEWYPNAGSVGLEVVRWQKIN